MSSIRIASRYAKSLIELAQSQSKLDQITTDLKTFKEALKQRDFFLMIKSPIIKSDKKRKIFKAIFEGKLNSLTVDFFDIVIRKGREDMLPEICDEYVRQYNALHSITTATVTTATDINDQLMSEIKEGVKKLGVTSENIQLVKKIDPSILGGFILQVEDKLYDASVRTKLNQIKKQFTDNTYIKSL